MNNIKVGFKVYISSFPLSLYVALIILTILLSIPLRNSVEKIALLPVYVDLMLLPMVAFIVALYLKRDSNVFLFELNLIRSFNATYIVSISIYYILLLVPGIIFLSSINEIKYLSIVACRILSYTALFSIALLIDNYRAAMFYLVTFIFIMPYAPLALFNNASATSSRLSPAASILSFFFAPTTSYINRNLLSLSIGLIMLANIVLSFFIIIVSYILFIRKEFSV